ncbi:oxoglutarate/iron-dependent oxygenase [Colletotrichum zoysiae]|uniref:Oxoglutarate/iron-dependent oxygenase n=1 Tax=Colletotrichum zoysiae TaxID=1216348 RepID=A0AAD9HM99_9PEZI|nr:oxoglutarate/iron-dependent oxygenase [Colletotrichum zoysiae]
MAATFIGNFRCLAASPILTAGVGLALYLFGLAIYRLYLHPLARFPGPKIAALTVLYEFYFDGIQRGRYTFEIQRMHEKYGPIIRISPDELHVNEPSFIDELYAGGGKKRDKYPYFSAQFGIPESVFGTPSHDLHRLRRGALNRFFSKSSVNRLEPVIHTAIEKLISQLRTHAGSGNPVAINMAFSCVTTDVVTEYAFAKSYNFLDSPTFEPNFHRAIIAGTDMGPWFKQFPWLITLMNRLPQNLVMRINPEAAIYVRFQEDIRRQIRQTENDIALGKIDSASGKTIFQELLTGDLPQQEKRLERLWQEGQIVIGAGTETTAWALSAMLFYVLDDSEVLRKLMREMESAIPDTNERVSWNRLEQLPYLSAVICEGLRLSYGVSTRLQRINPMGPLILKADVSPTNGEGERIFVEHEIPAGTPVGMTATLIHNHPDLFPDSGHFRPERWLDEEGRRHHQLDKYLLSFSRGSRQCIGINLAYAELYMVFGLLIRRMGSSMSLFCTTKEDVEIHYDRFVPTPKDGTRGVRVIIQPHEAI